MAQRLCLLLTITAWAGWAAGQSPYCSFTPEHTLCGASGLGPTCGSQVPGRGVSAQDAALILAQHNQLRSRVAMGQEGRGAPGPQPQAANMRQMEWDDELALVAQGHADQCIFEHECSDCRRVSRFGVGQNLFISFQSNFDTRIQWGRAIKAWYDEVAEFSPSAIQPFQFSTPVGHYTQMLWWSSYRVGCGYTMFQEDGWWKKLYTCNYGPGGNIILSQMYRPGSPCSACPAGTSCSLQYPGLCGPAAASAFATNQVFQQRTGPPAVRPNFFPQFFAHNQEAEQQEFEPAETEFEPAEAEEPQEQEFIPFTGIQPQVADLMPFLQRAGMNTQVIRTASLASVQGIINNLPGGLRPIVLFRSGSGHLTELDAHTLLPLRRVGRSTTTKLPNKEPSVLLTCDLDVSPCNIKPVGGVWSKGNTEAEGNFNQVQLDAGEGSQVVVQQLVSAPTTDAICVGLSHWRSLMPEAELNGTLPDVQIGVMPLRGEVSRLSLAGASGVWEMSRVSFNNITTPFQMLLTMGPTTDASKIAVDALQVTDGSCCMSGEC
ncbi:uncharacterized protein LOC125029251 [Penaeus chinensis]|uniref:uncharacterized protein LOC125029251 n=1 Tax=Penaeus chinensis TaxID=139456 RepID=UPI001FB64E0D|nr:uncharacterized protein LOC125029251 [Penaeus chinensis]XP_047475101.1 uncharacterized protein LOC125029251 [Penaeus chinensis]